MSYKKKFTKYELLKIKNRCVCILNKSPCIIMIYYFLISGKNKHNKIYDIIVNALLSSIYKRYTQHIIPNIFI